MIVVTGGNLVLPDRIVPEGAVLVDDERIVAVESRRVDLRGADVVAADDCYVVPGFIDVHVHGLEGHDTLDGGNAVGEIARRLPRYGVTAFAPTTVACPPGALQLFLEQVRRARTAPARDSARVLPAHLESNFINPEYRGAQPVECIRTPHDELQDGTFSGRDVLATIAAFRPDVGIVTIAPEVPGGIELVRTLAGQGHRVSLGHSGADFDTAVAAIEAGARHATHLFNRMSPFTHRAPGLPGAVLASEDVTTELICDGYHVHAAACRLVVAAKGTQATIAITDGTAGSGLPAGSSTRLGSRALHVREQAAFLEDGTLAGSTLTMDRAFQNIVSKFGRSIVDAATMCSTTPARALGLTGLGVLARDGIADFVILDRALRVVRTFVAGDEVWRAPGVRPR